MLSFLLTNYLDVPTTYLQIYRPTTRRDPAYSDTHDMSHKRRRRRDIKRLLRKFVHSIGRQLIENYLAQGWWWWWSGQHPFVSLELSIETIWNQVIQLMGRHFVGDKSTVPQIKVHLLLINKTAIISWISNDSCFCLSSHQHQVCGAWSVRLTTWQEVNLLGGGNLVHYLRIYRQRPNKFCTHLITRANYPGSNING